MYISVTNKLLNLSFMLQLSCIQLSKNIHRILHIYNLIAPLLSFQVSLVTLLRVWIARLVCNHPDSPKMRLNLERLIG